MTAAQSYLRSSSCK